MRSHTLGLLALICPHEKLFIKVVGKVVSGTAKITGANSENTISKFAFSPGGVSKIEGVFETDGMYVDERQLKLYLYSDDEWSKVRKRLTCHDKVRFARNSRPLSFDLVAQRTPSARVPNKDKNIEKYRANIQTTIDQRAAESPKYWYITLADCSLENYPHDADAPAIHYTVTIMDEYPKGFYSHLPSDEQSMQALNLFNLLGSVLLAAGLLLRAFVLIKQRNEIHFAMLLVIVACGMNAIGSLFELIHLQAYRRNGIGSYTADALSAHLEAQTDAVIAILLLAVAVGWTMPSDITIRINPENTGSGLLHVLEGLRNPSAAIQRGASSSGFLALLIIGVHAILAQWGRVYDEDFDCYHDFEHLPGKLLFFLRGFLGFTFLLGAAALRRSSHCSQDLKQFLMKFALVGTAWFLSLPAIALVSSKLIPSHMRHQAVSGWATIVQFSSLASLTWLFAADSSASAFHRTSKAAGSAFDSLGSSEGASPKSVFRLGNSKVRID